MSRKLSDTQLLNFIQNFKVDIVIRDHNEPNTLREIISVKENPRCPDWKFAASTGLTTCVASNVRTALNDLYELVNGIPEIDE